MAEHMWYERAQELEAEIARLRAELAAERDYVALLKRDGATLYSELEKARAELAAERERADAWQASWSSLKKELAAERAELAAELERAKNAEEALTIAYMQGAADMRTERDAALANVAKLREVLKPFAKAADDVAGDDSEDAGIGLTKGDLRRARAVLEETKGDGDD